jgi:hypothetical protein
MTATPDVNPAQQAPYPYPPQTAPVSGPKVSAQWTGALMALGALVAAVGTFLPFEKIVAFQGSAARATATFTGLGSKSTTGLPIPGLKAGNGGMIILIASVVALVCGLVVLANHGRVWVRIVGLLAVAVAGVLCMATFSAAHDDQKKLNATAAPGWSAHALVKLGVDVAAVGLGVAVVGAILAFFVRHRRAA